MKKVLFSTLLATLICFASSAKPSLPIAAKHLTHKATVKKHLAATPFSYDFTDTYTYSFYNDCSGEWVDLTETVTYSVHGVVNNNKYMVDTHISVKDEGVGETSGNRYSGSIEVQNHSNSTVNGAYTANYLENGVLATAGGGNNIKISQSFKVTVNSNGDVTVLRGDASYTCQ